MSEIKTQMFIPKPVRGATLFILDNRKEPLMLPLRGNATVGREYPTSDRTIRLHSEIVGRAHGEFIYDNSADTFYYIDNNSLNGTYINGIRLQPYNQRGSKAIRLSDGDILRIDRSDLSHPHPQAVLMIFSRSMEENEHWTSLDISNYPSVTIGRAEGNTLRINDDMASRQHAVIRLSPQGAMLSDCDSQNGVLVNAKPVSKCLRLFDNDVIRVANTMLVFSHGTIFYNNAGERSGCLSVHIHDKTVRNGFRTKTLIKDINFEADARDFILILGGSGAGKTTLINAVLGDGKANAEVLLNGQNLYENFKTMKSQVGLVPQFINLRDNDKVIATLMDIADIKLKGFSREEKEVRIGKILNTLGVENLKNHLIRQLSGGQKKKVSVAAQLVGFQKVFICDEPDSGLDAASRMQQMDILKDIADSGKIVMVISHEPDDAVNRETGKYHFTKVLVIARRSVDNCGHLAFFGDTDSALEYFGVKKLQDIMMEINPKHEGGKERADYYINRYKNGVQHG